MLVFWAWKTSDIWRHLRSAHYAMPLDDSCRSALSYGDTLLSYWLDWWVEMWAWHGKPSLFFCDLVNYPLGGPSALDRSLALVHTMLAGLIQPLVGPSAAINLVVMFGVALTLVAIFLAVRAVSGNGLLAAVLAILAITYGLARGNTLLDPELNFLAYTAFALLAWSRYVEQGGWKWLAAAALLIGITGFTHAYYGIALLACLGTAVVLSFCGLSFSGIADNTMLRRASLALALGLALTLLFHARNVVTLLAVDRTEAVQTWFLNTLGSNQYTLLDGAAVLVSVLVPAAAGWFLRVPNAIVWGLMCLPVAVISLGGSLYVRAPDVTLNMPLHWARENLPFLWRLSLPQRFVAPLMVGMAISYGALWRGLAASGASAGKRPEVRRLVVGIVLVGIYWTAAALVPLTPDTSEEVSGFGASAMPGADGEGPAALTGSGGTFSPCGGEFGPASEMTDPSGEPGNPYRFPKVPVQALFWVFQRVPVLPLPPIPECIHYLAQQEGEFAILELTEDKRRGFISYFQTIHGKALAGFTGLPLPIARLYVEPSELTLIQEQYWRGDLKKLPGPVWLRELGVRYVVHYDLWTRGAPQTMGPNLPDGRSAPNAHKRPLLDFDAVYGPPTCTDGMLKLYETGADRRAESP
jgi:hypothetical protein